MSAIVPGSALKRELRAPQFLMIGVGTIIGIAWIVVLGDWLGRAGPLAAALAFMGGGALMALIAACYCELATSMPYAGGEVVYTREIFGPRTSFGVGWFLVLTATATASFEAVAFGWLIATVFPEVQGPVLYSVLGTPISLDGLLLGLGATFVLTLINYRGVRGAGRLQDWSTSIKLIAVSVFIAGGLLWGSAENLQPLVAAGTIQSPWIGALWIAATAPFWFGGFQIIPQAIEERSASTSLRTVSRMAVLSILIGVIFYCLVIAASGMAAPRGELTASSLPAAHAMRSVLGSELLTRLVLLGAAAGILATWNACILWATRLLLAQGRAGFIPAVFGRTHPQFGSPAVAVVFVGVISAAGVFLGRGILLPVVNMGAMSLAFIYMICCFGLLRHRRRTSSPEQVFRVPGGRQTIIAATMAAAAMALFVLFEPLTRAHRQVPLEWILIGAWTVAGVCCWKVAPFKRRAQPPGVTAAERGEPSA